MRSYARAAPIAILAVMCGGSVHAQSTAQQVLTGSLANPPSCPSGQPYCFVPGPYYSTPLGYQQLTSSSLTASTALVVPTGATFCLIEAEAQAVRYRDDGITVSATVGQPITVGTTLMYAGNLAALRFIQTTASAIVNVSCYR